MSRGGVTDFERAMHLVAAGQTPNAIEPYRIAPRLRDDGAPPMRRDLHMKREHLAGTSAAEAQDRLEEAECARSAAWHAGRSASPPAYDRDAENVEERADGD